MTGSGIAAATAARKRARSSGAMPGHVGAEAHRLEIGLELLALRQASGLGVGPHLDVLEPGPLAAGRRVSSVVA